jgi:hemoglobin-like flavoprotein
MLTRTEIDVVQADWRAVERIADVAGTLFYDRLFELDPSVRPLFKGDMAAQKTKLIKMIGAAVWGLGSPDLLMPIVRFLGRKHARFGVEERHYETVGAALMWTLRKGLGPAFGAASEAAWLKVYEVLAEAMKAGATGDGDDQRPPGATDA